MEGGEKRASLFPAAIKGAPYCKLTTPPMNMMQPNSVAHLRSQTKCKLCSIKDRFLGTAPMQQRCESHNVHDTGLGEEAENFWLIAFS
jgi:hypothetical protein